MEGPCIFFLAMVVVLITVGISLSLAGADGEETPRAYYRRCIDTCIWKLANKARCIDFGSAVLQRKALRAAMKKVFFEQYREPLVDRMVRDRVARKPYKKAAYYLDRQFYRVIHPRLARR